MKTTWKNKNEKWKMKYEVLHQNWINTPPPPTLNLSLSSIYSIHLPHTINANIIHLIQPNHDRRKNKEEKQANKTNQYIFYDNSNLKTPGDAPRPATSGWCTPFRSNAILMKNEKWKSTTKPTTVWNSTIIL